MLWRRHLSDLYCAVACHCRVVLAQKAAILVAVVAYVDSLNYYWFDRFSETEQNYWENHDAVNYAFAVFQVHLTEEEKNISNQNEYLLNQFLAVTYLFLTRIRISLTEYVCQIIVIKILRVRIY